MTWRIGVDCGSTFTDVCLSEEASGRVEMWKLPSAPDDPSRGVMEGVGEGLARVGAEAARTYFGYGTAPPSNPRKAKGAMGRVLRVPGLAAWLVERAIRLLPSNESTRGNPREIRHDGTRSVPWDWARAARINPAIEALSLLLVVVLSSTAISSSPLKRWGKYQTVQATVDASSRDPRPNSPVGQPDAWNLVFSDEFTSW